MDRLPVNKNVPPKTARMRAVIGWIVVVIFFVGGLYWIFKK